MSGVHDHDIQKAVDQLKSEGRDQYLDREPESSGSGKNKKDSNIWDLWWGIKPHHDKSKKYDKSEKPHHDKSKKHDKSEKPHHDKSKKHDKSEKPHHDKSKKPDDCKKHDKSKKPHHDKSKKPDKKPKCRHKRWEYHHYDKKKHHKSSKSGYEKYTEWYEGNVTEVKYRKV
ncbi:hypothetical protein L3137_19380 [Bacillus sonorensis]|uniref:spore coat protein CotG n=2 Tax=Bacillus sonorensis TaxID=119858 RepID=UPI001F2E9733|nr:hypothetical protein [Bacillus sonorensis]MCF7619416.1 hypothetical protein [Bacillus sonorensis]